MCSRSAPFTRRLEEVARSRMCTANGVYRARRRKQPQDSARVRFCQIRARMVLERVVYVLTCTTHLRDGSGAWRAPTARGPEGTTTPAGRYLDGLSERAQRVARHHRGRSYSEEQLASLAGTAGVCQAVFDSWSQDVCHGRAAAVQSGVTRVDPVGSHRCVSQVGSRHFAGAWQEGNFDARATQEGR